MTFHQNAPYRANWSPSILPEAGYVQFRAPRPEDAQALVDMHRRLSKKSRYFRYLRPYVPELKEMASICSLSDEGGGVLIAVQAESDRTIIGLAYYIRNDPPDVHTAELAIVVDEGLQGRGYGRALLEALFKQAQSKGVVDMEAHVHPTNRRMLHLLDTCMRPLRMARTLEVTKVTVNLSIQHVCYSVHDTSFAGSGHIRNVPGVAMPSLNRNCRDDSIGDGVCVSAA